MAVTGRIREWSVVPAARSIRRLVILAIALLALGGWLIWRQLQGPELPAYRLEARPLVQRVVASGEVDSQSLAQVGSEITGVVAARHVREGDAVNAGDLLLELRDDEQRARLREAEAVALALRTTGLSALASVLVAAASGLMEPIGALVGIGMSSGFAIAYPVSLGLAAGAMIFVVSHEVIPETHRNGHQTPATLGLMVGFAVMMFLDTALG